MSPTATAVSPGRNTPVDTSGVVDRDRIHTVDVELTAEPGATLIVPTGMETPYERIASVGVGGGHILNHTSANGLGQGALIVRAEDKDVRVQYRVAPSTSGRYPEIAFTRRGNRHTRAADDLTTASRQVAAAAGGALAAVKALVAEAESRFDYAHPDERFTDGLDHVPYLSCGGTEGSCVDINTYLVASLRAADLEAAYLYGYFFPQEKGGETHDMHCWVVTRAEGEVLEWDIAHHIKAGLGSTRPGLNPRPGRRVALGHSMGHHYQLPSGSLEVKLLAEPMCVTPAGAQRIEGLRIRAH